MRQSQGISCTSVPYYVLFPRWSGREDAHTGAQFRTSYSHATIGWFIHAIDAAAHITRHISDTVLRGRLSPKPMHSWPVSCRQSRTTPNSAKPEFRRRPPRFAVQGTMSHNVTQCHIISQHNLIALMALIVHHSSSNHSSVHCVQHIWGQVCNHGISEKATATTTQC